MIYKVKRQLKLPIKIRAACAVPVDFSALPLTSWKLGLIDLDDAVKVITHAGYFVNS